MAKETDFTSARERMVDEQLIPRRIRDERVLDAMRAVPRHLFIPSDMGHLAYVDAPLPIGHRQTISQPFIVALMTELLELEGHEKVLEVGTGSGYQAAVLAHVAQEVYTLERIEALVESAQVILNELELENVHVVLADGSKGLPEHAPFDAIIVTAAAPNVPIPLQEQLIDGGRLVLPVGSRDGQILERWVRDGDDFKCEKVAPVAFVPLVGEFGWDSEERSSSWWR
ncbi:MAG: protein-L-isoaspartate(D-aspartate) O-methyltransferase [Anaerolineales bacterium]|nr:protein-L-isoaspartate(D-aspartate) O-methyltransferase [Anaerolineales bacterium]